MKTAIPDAANADQQRVIPLLEEQLVIGKRVAETGAVVLRKHTEERTETVDVSLTSIQWHVEHVPLDRVITEPPLIRREGETTVYPVTQERLVVMRELVLVEEVRVTAVTTTIREQKDYTLRREQVTENHEPISLGKKQNED